MHEFILPKGTLLSVNEFLRFGQYDWNDVMAIMAQHEDSAVIDGHTVRLNKLKYQTFIRDCLPAVQ